MLQGCSRPQSCKHCCEATKQGSARGDTAGSGFPFLSPPCGGKGASCLPPRTRLEHPTSQTKHRQWQDVSKHIRDCKIHIFEVTETWFLIPKPPFALNTITASKLGEFMSQSRLKMYRIMQRTGKLPFLSLMSLQSPEYTGIRRYLTNALNIPCTSLFQHPSDLRSRMK